MRPTGVDDDGRATMFWCVRDMYAGGLCSGGDNDVSLWVYVTGCVRSVSGLMICMCVCMRNGIGYV